MPHKLGRMKYIGIILLFFAFLLFARGEDCATKVREAQNTSVLSSGQKNGYYTADKELPVLYGMEQDAGRFFSSFRFHWMHAQQSIIERTVLGLKRIISLVSSRETMLKQQQYVLFNHRFFYSQKPCSLYYVYAIRHIII